MLDGEKLPGGLRAVHLPGATAGCVAFHAKQDGGIVFIGDLLLNIAGKGLSLLLAQYVEDSKQMTRSIRRLMDLDFKIATFAHGEPSVGDAKKQIATFLNRSKRNTQ